MIKYEQDKMFDRWDEVLLDVWGYWGTYEKLIIILKGEGAILHLQIQ
jgi:hypothetical protein